MKMRYCIWDCGNRGKNIYDFMRGKDVCAFIDRNPALQGTEYQGTPVISFDEFLMRFRKCIVIISPFGYEDKLENLLIQNGVHSLRAFFLPPEITEVPVPNLLELVDKKVRDRTAYFYGLNLYSILLLDHYRTTGSRAIKLIPEDGAEKWLVEAVEDSYPNCFAGLDQASNLYLTSNRCVTEKVLNHKPVNIYDFLYVVDWYYHPELERFKNAHKGRRCFILGTGPSLEIRDLDTLKENGELRISVNGIIRAYPFTQWRPDYYMITDKIAYEGCKEDLLGDSAVEYMLISDAAMRGDESDGFLTYHISALPISEDCPACFSKDISRGVYAGGQVTYAAIQLAVYLGCSEIYLYGIDFDYSNFERAHFAKDYVAYKNGAPTNSTIDETMRRVGFSFKRAKQAAEQMGFKIYNASRRTKLDVFERVDFDSLFDGGPVRFL